MIFVDTSVWIAAFRNKPGVGKPLRRLLDRDEVALAIPVRIEILTGASRIDRPRLQRLLSALPHYLPGEGTWSRMEGWTEKTVRAGERFGMGDMLIGAIAEGERGRVWSLDADFGRMEALGFLRRYAPKLPH